MECPYNHSPVCETFSHGYFICTILLFLKVRLARPAGGWNSPLIILLFSIFFIGSFLVYHLVTCAINGFFNLSQAHFGLVKFYFGNRFFVARIYLNNAW